MSSLQQCGCSRAVRLQAELLPLVARERLGAVQLLQQLVPQRPGRQSPGRKQCAPPFARQPTAFAPAALMLAPQFLPLLRALSYSSPLLRETLPERRSSAL